MRHRADFLVILSALGLVSCASWGFTPKTRPATSETEVSTLQTTNESANAASPTSSHQSQDSGVQKTSSHNASFSSTVQIQPTGGEDDIDVVIEPCSLVDEQLKKAQNALMRSNWIEALSISDQASLCGEALERAKQISFYAATQMDLGTIQSSWRASTSALSRAALGLEGLRLCEVKGDEVCVDELKQGTVQALSAIGMAETASETLSWLGKKPEKGRAIVAVALPLSGRDRRMGRAVLGGLLQAAGAYAHKGTAYDLRFFDTESDAQTLPNIVSQASSLGAHLLLGPLDVVETQAASQALASHDMVMISFSPNDGFVNERAFQLSFSVDTEADVIARTILLKGFKSVAVAYPEGKYGDMLYDGVESKVGPGIRFSRFTYPANQTDLREVAKKVAAFAPDAMFLPSEAKDADKVMSFVAQENLWCRKMSDLGRQNAKTDTRKWTACFSTSVWAPVPADHAYRFLNGAQYLDYVAGVSGGSEFAVGFEKLYHRAPNVYELLPFVAVNILNTLSSSDFSQSQSVVSALNARFSGFSHIIVPAANEVFQ